MNDTQRLDAIGEYGLMITTHDRLIDGAWERKWVVSYSEYSVIAPTLREAIDAAVLDLRTKGLGIH